MLDRIEEIVINIREDTVQGITGENGPIFTYTLLGIFDE
jgi:hypothetical protein